jgi:hypothetical protein
MDQMLKLGGTCNPPTYMVQHDVLSWGGICLECACAGSYHKQHGGASVHGPDTEAGGHLMAQKGWQAYLSVFLP